MPTRRWGRSREEAISVTERADVFVARTASGADHGLDAPEQVLLDGEILEHGLDHEVAVGERRDVVDRLEQPEHALLVLLGRAAPFSTPRASCRSIGPLPRAASSLLDSQATVGTPAWMQSWAMPEPIVPSPTTPTFSTVRAPSVLRSCARLSLFGC